MEKDEIRNRVDELYSSAKKINEELNEIRSSCIHDEYRIENYSWRPGNITPVKMCKFCDELLGKPGDEEIAEFIESNKI